MNFELEGQTHNNSWSDHLRANRIDSLKIPEVGVRNMIVWGKRRYFKGK